MTCLLGYLLPVVFFICLIKLSECNFLSTLRQYEKNLEGSYIHMQFISFGETDLIEFDLGFFERPPVVLELSNAHSKACSGVNLWRI